MPFYTLTTRTFLDQGMKLDFVNNVFFLVAVLKFLVTKMCIGQSNFTQDLGQCS